MDLILEPLGYGIFLRALVAVSLVGAVCAVVGTFVVLRGLAFIGDAISHAAFPGVVAAFILRGPYYVGAAVAAVATALTITFISRRTSLRTDTAIGVLFAGTFAFGIFLYSTIEGYVGDLFGFLVGNVLAISPADLIGLAILSALVLGTVLVFWKELLYATFDPLGAAASGLPVSAMEYLFLVLVALTIVISLQAVGIILVVAMLVTPAATAQLVTARFERMLLAGLAIGIGASVAGLYLSFWFDVASGATIVLVQTAVFVVALLFAPRGGLLRRRRGPATPTRSPAG
jgi:manganese/iron transport system permease protein